MFAVCKELVLSFRYTAEMSLFHLTNRQVELLQAFSDSGRLQFKLWRNNNVTGVMSEVPMFIQKRKHNYQTVERKAVDSTGRDVLVQFHRNEGPNHEGHSSAAAASSSHFEVGRNSAEILIKFEIKISTASDGQSQYFFKCLVGDVEIFRTTPYFTTRARNHREIKRKRESLQQLSAAAAAARLVSEDSDSVFDPATPTDTTTSRSKKVFPSSNKHRRLSQPAVPVDGAQRDRMQLLHEISHNLQQAPTEVIARINKQISSLPQLVMMSAAPNRYSTRSGLTQLHKACLDGETRLAHELIKSRRFFVNCQDNAGDTPLHLACFHGHTDTAVMLLNCDADFLVLNNEKKLPIDKAVDGAQHQTVIELLEWMNSKYIASDSPAHDDITRFIAQITQDLTAPSLQEGTPLTEAQSTDDEEGSENEPVRDSPSENEDEN